MNEEISSDTVLALMGLFRERLPCSENFWRYKRNYDLYLKMMQQNKDNSDKLSSGVDKQSVKSGDGQSVLSGSM